tara:strand:+ start:9621 stop:10199 length:579 start_codon:yes stop_codon:yes gene_type:complete
MDNQEVKQVNRLREFTKFIESKKKILIGIFIVLILLISYFFIIESNKKNNDLLISENFNKAKILITNKQPEESKKILLKLIEENHKIYSPLSLYMIIEEDLEKNNDKIIILFEEVLKNNKILQEDKDLIKIKKAIFISGFENESKILEILNPIINSKSIWRYEAINLMIRFFDMKGEKNKSEEYKRLLKSNL